MPARTHEEIVVGRATLDSIGAAIGDVVPVRIADRIQRRRSTPVHDGVGLRIVGVATFPPVSQAGTDVPRLVLCPRHPRKRFSAWVETRTNQPEFTMVRVTQGTDPAIADCQRP